MFLFSKKSREAKVQAEKQAEKQAKKEAAIAEYKEKRNLTLSKFFDIAQLPFPEKFKSIADRPVSDFTADPRRLTENSVFMCWQKSPKSVGSPEDALTMAMNKKCLFIISNMQCSYPNSLILSDTAENGDSIIKEAYIRASHYIRSIHKAKVIAVTGSVSKTSAKEMLESVLRAHYKKPVISKGNNNSMFSVTRNIQKLKRPTNVYLQEVGAFERGTITASAKQLEADMTLYTNIGVSHIESYGSREALAQDKLSLSTYGKPDGTVFINYDDEILTAYPFTQNVITYSLENENAMYFAKEITITENAGLQFTIVDRPAGEEHRAEVFVPGRHNVLNAVAAYAVGKALKLKPEEILSGISAYRPAGMRQNIIHPCGYNIFADCYNSSLLAIENTLGAMDDILIPPGGRRIAVLGDILGLGDISEETHRQIAEVLSNHKIDLLLGYGDSIRFTVSEASKLGIEAKYFENRIELESEILNTIRPEDLILFKASHDINLGASIDRLFGTDINESSNIAHKKFYLKVQGDFEYYIFETSASVKTYLGTDKRVEIPSHIEAEITDELHNITETRLLSVEKIGKTAFRENTHIREVVLPPTVVRIRDGAFKGSSIRRFEGTESLLSIGDEAFADCDELETVLISRNTTDIGENITENSPKASLEYI